MKNKVLIINQVFWPDQHNTARHISELSEELVKRGWNLTALIGNRSYFDHTKKLTPKIGVWKGVKYRRVYVPGLNQRKNIQRLFTSFYLILNLITWLPRIGKFDAIIIGTNPPFLYLIIPFIKMFDSKSKIILWSFDLYPEAIMATGGIIWKLLGKCVRPITKFCYNRLDVIADIGPCMRELLRKYKHSAIEITLTPWSFIEPVTLPEIEDETRKKLFGNSSLALLYTGTLGIAHKFKEFIKLAQDLRKNKISAHICFAGFGNKFENLKIKISNEDTNISFVGFADNDNELEKRLSSADILLISLKDDWAGISVPSKFFGAIANGKPVLFAGPENSSISIWINFYKVGFNLSFYNMDYVIEMLRKFADDKSLLDPIKQNAFETYNKYFSKKVICDKWSELLRKIIE
ncbi:MAG: glycosyltransferase family 4 protein [Bacteroidales bacterium]|nr:glycosyltransferase family 4 protein [Bacteroidales bacterium]